MKPVRTSISSPDTVEVTCAFRFGSIPSEIAVNGPKVWPSTVYWVSTE